MIRLFVAIELPSLVKDHLSNLGSVPLRGARWLGFDQLHLTLQFIGEVERNAYDNIKEVLAEVDKPSFSFNVQGVGCFPPGKKPTVLWAGVQKSEPLIGLKNQIEKKLKSINIFPEARKFSPHITVGRLKNPPLDKVGLFLSLHNLLKIENILASEFTLFSSRLAPIGAVYQKEATFSLK